MVTGAKTRLWDPPSPEAADLIGRAVERLLGDPSEILAAIYQASEEQNRELLELEPRLADALQAAAVSNFTHWVAANLRDPGMPVGANLSAENVEFARIVVRHGFDETILAGFRASQNVAIAICQELVFDLTTNLDLARECLAVTSRSIFAYVDDTLAELSDMIKRERSQLTDATHVARLEAVTLILEGAPMSEARASDRLKYELGRRHLAAVVWADAQPSPGRLEAVADTMARALGARRPLLLPVGQSSLWIWISGQHDPEIAAIRAALEGVRDVRVALGRPGHGLDGFRASHLEATAVQRLVRRLPVRSTVTTYEDIEVVALATQDEERATEFVLRTLGALATGPQELRETLRVYLSEQCNLTRTASVLFAHRNTIMARLDRARGLLPNGLEGHTVPITMALEIAHLVGIPAIP